MGCRRCASLHRLVWWRIFLIVGKLPERGIPSTSSLTTFSISLTAANFYTGDPDNPSAGTPVDADQQRGGLPLGLVRTWIREASTASAASLVCAVARPVMSVKHN